MKTILYILIFNFSAIGFAQDPQLFENTWYLQNVIINGTNNVPPVNDEVPFIGLELNQTNPQFLTYVCNSAEGEVSFDPINPEFTFVGKMTFTLIFCNDPNNQIFEGLYFGFYNDEVTQPFTYSITTGPNDSKTLTITSASSNQAIYGNQLLSTQDFSNSIFSLFPNPVKDELVLTSENQTRNLKIKIFNVRGKLLSTQNLTLENQASINISNLSDGMYFLNIENENGNMQVKKFIKE